MAKFGLFEVGSLERPKQEYEGEYLEINGDTVNVMVNDGTGNRRAFAVIRLAEGQSVKTIKE